jgi:MoaE-MoaD fusion protein
MNVKVLFFANLKDLAGTRQELFDLPDGASVTDLLQMISNRHPSLKKTLPSILVAVNHEFAGKNDVIPNDAEVALFPPVSGGAEAIQEHPTICQIIEGQIDLNDLLEKITLPTTGAACFFTGMVRGVTTRDFAHETSYLEYEAYLPMAEEKMRQVAGEIREKWPTVEGISIVQRIGKLDPGTPTVLIACTAGHRDTGVFEAARYGIDRLKQIVPVWKKEVSPQGEVWVEGDYQPKPNE